MDSSALPIWQAFVLLACAFYLLAKGADWLVDGSVGIAERFRVPKLLIGIVLLGFATTAPEFAVSFLSALAGIPEMALGNAVGSVIVDDGVALALVGILSTAPALVNRRLLIQSGVFLVIIDILAFVFAVTDSTLSRAEGGVLVGCFFIYLGYVLWDRWKHPAGAEGTEGTKGGLEGVQARVAGRGLGRLVILFVMGLCLVIGASKVVVMSAERIATWAGIPEAVVALTVVAIGTSLPEIATCVTAARRGQGALAVGDIIGADILNIAWIAGASAIANPLVVPSNVVWFMFPSMMVIVLTTLGGLAIRGRMTRALGCVLLAEYVVYMATLSWLTFVTGAFPVSTGH
ncbi:MAG: sodium:calcium antiporter [Planctomycetota bacterium]|jgi:cation:H+ antiporter